MPLLCAVVGWWWSSLYQFECRTEPGQSLSALSSQFQQNGKTAKRPLTQDVFATGAKLMQSCLRKSLSCPLTSLLDDNNVAARRIDIPIEFSEAGRLDAVSGPVRLRVVRHACRISQGGVDQLLTELQLENRNKLNVVRNTEYSVLKC